MVRVVSAAWLEALNPPRREVTFVPTQACWRPGQKEPLVFLQSYCQATQGISLQQLIPTKLPIKVPFKVRNVTLVTIAWGGTHLTLAECVFSLHETTPEKAKCVFSPHPRARCGYAAD